MHDSASYRVALYMPMSRKYPNAKPCRFSIDTLALELVMTEERIEDLSLKGDLCGTSLA